MNDTEKQQLQKHLDLVARWGKHINLTTIKDPDQMWSHHVVDSLAAASYLKGESFIDIGTGAGFPGIPLAVILPNKRFTLVDSNDKKIQFLNNVIAQLGLSNVKAVHARIEEAQIEPADGVISRALGDMAEMCAQSDHLLKTDGHFYWMKGQYPQEELNHLPFEAKVHKLEIPELSGAQRHMVVIRKQTKQ